MKHFIILVFFAFLAGMLFSQNKSINTGDFSGRNTLSFVASFSPNSGGGVAEVFKPALKEGTLLANYRLMVYNRWGELVFESQLPENGWDGLFLDKPANPDDYVYKAEGIYANGKPFSKVGKVTLIRK
jgi:gliding motility-associated-like protein